jgi:arsenate reductase (thioredoxin)
MLNPTLHETVEKLILRFGQITPERKAVLTALTNFIRQSGKGQTVYLNFICTHNSRRSHIAQLWAQAAAHHFQVKDIVCLSGGTEATAFNPRAVKAMQEAGFGITIEKPGDNPVYQVSYSSEASSIMVFSKKYDDVFNNNPGFAAVMTCSHADENCPLVLGAKARIAITYDDPKEFDGTPLESTKYAERVEQIGTEMLYAFSQVKQE